MRVLVAYCDVQAGFAACKSTRQAKPRSLFFALLAGVLIALVRAHDLAGSRAYQAGPTADVIAAYL